MGGIVTIESHEDASLIYRARDGSIRIAEDFAKGYEKEMPFEVKRPIVTLEHETLIRQHWAAVARGTSVFQPAKHITPAKFFYTTFYSKLFERIPEARALFRSSMSVQGRSLTGIVSTLASIIRSPDVVETTQNLALEHARFGATKDHYTAVGLTLLETLEYVSGPEWSIQIKNAYLTTYCFLYYLMLPVILSTKPSTIDASIPGRITIVKNITENAKCLTIEVDFPLRYHPGDMVVVGPKENDLDTCVPFPISSVYDANVKSLEICVDEVSTDWLYAATPNTIINVYWVHSGVHFEIDTPETIYKKLLFISEGLIGAGFNSMIKGLSLVPDSNPFDIIWMQCDAKLISYFTPPNCRVLYSSTLTIEFLESIADLTQRHVYIGGSEVFITNSFALLHQMGLEDLNTHSYTLDIARTSINIQI
ncbi:hypothetical protein THRCLA_01214 [Thraustotheca clavata]|uniref:Uncharacterized protein n=1 Tax=Thraustotheca clavata TaxID=74557 RepID=A0A1W0A8Y7_9STRA|nr:hypothetical protein THRCLA_01214 [Thraustotheca clavata]